MKYDVYDSVQPLCAPGEVYDSIFSQLKKRSRQEWKEILRQGWKEYKKSFQAYEPTERTTVVQEKTETVPAATNESAEPPLRVFVKDWMRVYRITVEEYARGFRRGRDGLDSESQGPAGSMKNSPETSKDSASGGQAGESVPTWTLVMERIAKNTTTKLNAEVARAKPEAISKHVPTAEAGGADGGSATQSSVGDVAGGRVADASIPDIVKSSQGGDDAGHGATGASADAASGTPAPASGIEPKTPSTK